VAGWREAVKSGAAYEGEFRLRRGSDGTYRWHMSRAVPERNAEGNIVAWLGTFTDFEDLKQAIRARDEFLSIASHELRTPLTALKLRLQALLYAKGLDEKLEKKLESATRQTQRLERLIDNLLDISRMTTGHLEIEPEELELAELAHDVVERLRDEASASGSQIQFEATSRAAGRWDRLRIEQVVTNLLSNAVKYGEGKPIVVRVSADDGKAEISVRDRTGGRREGSVWVSTSPARSSKPTEVRSRSRAVAAKDRSFAWSCRGCRAKSSSWVNPAGADRLARARRAAR
jgi:signal transduction histidine kinase